jgi:hypothetical protein
LLVGRCWLSTDRSKARQDVLTKRQLRKRCELMRRRDQ